MADRILLIMGGRDYTDAVRLQWALAEAWRRLQPTALRHGACPTGADAGAHWWALERGYRVEAMPADWLQGKGAGPRRNQVMLDRGGVVGLVAFPGGRRTTDMVRRAKAAGVRVWEVAPRCAAGYPVPQEGR